MSVYKYKAIDANDNIVENNIKAPTLEDARHAVIEKGLVLVKLEEVKGIDSYSIDIFNKISAQDIIVFCRELAMVIKSGVSLIVGLDIIKKQNIKGLKKPVQYIGVEVQKGKTLTQAMKETEIKFPELLTKMVSIGETSGSLDAILENMGDYYERDLYIRQKIIGALIYPIILVVVAVGLLIFFAELILPTIVELMAGQQLPLITKFVISSTSIIVSKYSLGLILLGIAGIVIFKKLVPSKRYKRIRDTIILNIPVIGPLIKSMITVRFTRTLYLLIKSGMDIVNILEILKSIMSNSVAESALDFALEGVKRGEKFGTMLSHTSFFDPLVVQMISMGEETGELESILEQITSFYERKLELKIEKVVALMEPMFTLVIGSFIGFIIVAMALPIFSMVGGLQQPGGSLGVE